MKHRLERECVFYRAKFWRMRWGRWMLWIFIRGAGYARTVRETVEFGRLANVDSAVNVYDWRSRIRAHFLFCSLRSWSLGCNGRPQISPLMRHSPVDRGALSLSQLTKSLLWSRFVSRETSWARSQTPLSTRTTQISFNAATTAGRSFQGIYCAYRYDPKSSAPHRPMPLEYVS